MTYCALSQRELAKRTSTLSRARDLYIMAGDNQMPLGLICAAETSAELENDLPEHAKHMTVRAAREGLFSSAKMLFQKYKKLGTLDIDSRDLLGRSETFWNSHMRAWDRVKK